MQFSWLHVTCGQSLARWAFGSVACLAHGPWRIGSRRVDRLSALRRFRRARGGRAVGSRFIFRTLRGDDHADAEGAGLLHGRDERALGGRILRVGRQEAVHLVEHHQGAQALAAGQGTHPKTRARGVSPFGRPGM